MILHIINKSPFSSSSLNDCLQIASEKDCILLIEDAVYGVTSQRHVTVFERSSTKICALGEDLSARGLSLSSDAIITVDYDGFVALTCHYKSSMTWTS